MNELDSILRHWRGDRGAAGVLATVVHVEGSAYRRPGARMLICADGTRIGTISGGCLEGDVVKKAPWWTAGGKTVLRSYDTRSDDDAVWEFGLGCNGVIHLLIEPLNSMAVQESLRFLDRNQSGRRPSVVATLIRADDGSARAGERLLVDPRGVAGGSLRGSPWEDRIAPHAAAAFADRRSRFVQVDESEIFVEWIGAPQSLVVFGAGHDAIPLASIASSIGWRVTVADGRPAYADGARFPSAQTILMPPSADVSGIDIHRDTAVVMMTHNYPLDKLLLPQILPRKPRYLGMLGPKRRTERLFDELGFHPAGGNLHFPVGLDIGADNPETIALAIVAEIQAELSARPGMPLKWRRDPIHSPARVIGRPKLAIEDSVAAVCEIHDS